MQPLCVVLLCFCGVALSQDTATNDTIPYCDEIDTHPSTGTGAAEPPTLPAPIGSPLETIPDAAAHAQTVQDIISQVGGSEVEHSVVQFGGAVNQGLSQTQSLKASMAERQTEIDTLVQTTLPSLEQMIASRRDRAGVVRRSIDQLNQKLRSLVDSLDRSSYVREQQVFMTIIDGLMRIQNSIEMKIMGGSSPYVPRTTAPHPAANALLSVSQDTVPSAKQSEKDLTELYDTLDLLEVESMTVASESLPYERRANLLLKRISSLLGRLIDKFSDLRQKHKEFARTNRELWSQELDILQRQADDMNAILEAVLDQGQFYVQSYLKHKDHLKVLLTAQRQSLDNYEATKAKITEMGQDFHQTQELRATQLRKLNELNHYLTQGNTEYVESQFNFACDGVIDGSATVDQCGVCGGGDSTCVDCALKPNGSTQLDVCGVCGGDGKSCRYFCDGVANSGNTLDLCGVCGGNNDTCFGCDGLPNSGLAADRCGVCGGDGSSCPQTQTH